MAREFRTPEQEQAEKGRDVAAGARARARGHQPAEREPVPARTAGQGYFERLRNEDPVHFNEIESAGRYWSVTKYDDIKTVSSDWQTFSSSFGMTVGFRGRQPRSRRSSTAGEPRRSSPRIRRAQTEQRKTVRPSVAPRNLAKLEPHDPRADLPACSTHFPRTRTSTGWMHGLDRADHGHVGDTLRLSRSRTGRKLTRWSDIVFAIPEPGGVVESQAQKRDEMMECVTYFSRLWEERRANPGDDLVSMLVHGEATKHMSAMDHLGNLLLLIVGGNDTTRNTMTGSVYGLNKFPGQYDKLMADPGLVDKMVPEIIRWQTPLSYMRRTATRDCELGGKTIRKHDQLLMWYISANRDEGCLRERQRDRHRAPEREPAPVLRLRHPLLHGQSSGRAPASRALGRGVAALPSDRNPGRTRADLFFLREWLHDAAGEDHAQVSPRRARCQARRHLAPANAQARIGLTARRCCV